MPAGLQNGPCPSTPPGREKPETQGLDILLGRLPPRGLERLQSWERVPGTAWWRWQPGAEGEKGCRNPTGLWLLLTLLSLALRQQSLDQAAAPAALT